MFLVMCKNYLLMTCNFSIDCEALAFCPNAKIYFNCFAESLNCLMKFKQMEDFKFHNTSCRQDFNPESTLKALVDDREQL